MAQANEGIFWSGLQEMVDHTPGGALVAGAVVGLGSGANRLVGITPTALEASRLGTLSIGGIYKLKKEVGGAVTFSAGDAVDWDDTNNTAIAAGTGDFGAGVCTEDAADGDDHVKTKINGVRGHGGDVGSV